MRLTHRQRVLRALLTGVLVWCCLRATWSAEIHDAAAAGDLAKVRKLLAADPRQVALTTDKGRTPLHLAAENGRTDVVKVLLAAGGDVNAWDGEYYAPLFFAADGDMVKLLVAHGADVNARDLDGRTMLFTTIEEENAELAGVLIAHGADVNTRDRFGLSPLWAAAGITVEGAPTPGREGAPRGKAALKVLTLFLDSRPDLNATDDEGHTLLHRAARDDDGTLTKLLLARGADVKRMDEGGYTPLHLARSAEVVALLVAGGADVNARSGKTLRRIWEERVVEMRETPLHIACGHRRETATAEALIAHGANINARDADGETPLHAAAWDYDTTVLKLLLAKGADVSAKNRYGYMPLAQAAKFKQEDAMKLLSAAGSKVDLATAVFRKGPEVVAALVDAKPERLKTRYEGGQTALHLALWLERFKVAEVLVAKGADVRARDKDGNTPLHLASREIAVDLMRQLLARGADVNARNENGETPLLVLGNSVEGGRKDAAVHKAAAELLIAHGADLRATSQWGGGTVLHAAARSGSLEAVELFLAKGLALEARDREGRTALFYASARWPDVALALIAKGADVTVRDRDGETALHRGVLYGREKVAEALIAKGADVNAPDANGDTALHEAMSRRRPSMIALLLKGGADVRARNARGETPLHVAAAWGKLEVIEKLLAAGAELHARTKQGATVLHMAAHAQDTAAARFFLGKGLAVNVRDAEGLTPLHYAVNGEQRMVSFLLEQGALLDARTQRGWTPLLLATWTAMEESNRMAYSLLSRGAKLDVASAAALGRTDWVTRLVAADPSLAKRMPGYKGTPLHWAARCGREETARLLIARGADVNVVEEKGDTPLHWAIGDGNEGLIALLLKHDARVDVRGEDGDTPLHRACTALGNADVVGKLLAAGADVKARNDAGETPLHCAAAGVDTTDTIKLLLAKGAEINARDKKGRTPLACVNPMWGEEVRAFLKKHGAKE